MAKISNCFNKIAIVCLIYLLATLWRVTNVLFFDSWDNVYYRFDTRLSGLLLGFLAAFIVTKTKLTDARWADAVAILSIFVLVLCSTFFRWGDKSALLFGVTIVELASVGLILAAFTRKGLAYRLFSWFPLSFIGLISYAIYLWHYPIAVFVRNELSPVASFALVALFSFCFALISWVFVEKPLAHYRRRRLNTISK